MEPESDHDFKSSDSSHEKYDLYPFLILITNDIQ